jgi:hypothetical protein
MRSEIRGFVPDPRTGNDIMADRLIFGLLGLAMAGAAANFAPAPAMAQVQDRVVDVYGDDPCPSSNGREIVVCKRHPRGEQYRIPRDLRESESSGWSPSASAVSAVNSTGGSAAQVQSCNAIGGGVSAGCVKKEADAWKAQKRAEKQEQDSIP